MESSNFYAICPNCGKALAFQGADIQYYKPVGTELNNTQYSKQAEVMDTGKAIACPFCKKVAKASEYKFVINDF